MASTSYKPQHYEIYIFVFDYLGKYPYRVVLSRSLPGCLRGDTDMPANSPGDDRELSTCYSLISQFIETGSACDDSH